MSLPDEQVRAQERLWRCFVDGEFPRKLWPKHMMSSAEVKMLFDRVAELEKEVESLRGIRRVVIEAVRLEDLVRALGITPEEMEDAISSSDISHGNNDDTLVTVERICSLLRCGIPSGVTPDTLVSIGC